MTDRTLSQICQEARAARAVLARFRPLVEEFLAKQTISQTSFSVKAAGNTDFVRHMRAGRRGFHTATVDNVLKFISEHAE